MIFSNPSGAPELACDQCGCRWFDRLGNTNTCYECGAPVTPENLAEIEAALAAFAVRQQSNPTSSERAVIPAQEAGIQNTVIPAQAGIQDESFGFPPSRE
jgi:hypothetical protein